MNAPRKIGDPTIVAWEFPDGRTVVAEADWAMTVRVHAETLDEWFAAFGGVRS